MQRRRPAPGALFGGGIPLTWVVVMRRYLVVANQTLQAAELREELRNRISEGPCSLFVIVPDTKATDYDPVWLGADLPHQAERRFGLPVTTIITG